MPLSSSLNRDSGNRYFMGPGDYKWAGTQVGATDFGLGHVLLVDASGVAIIVSAGADDESNTAGAVRTMTRLQGFDGTTWDRLRTAAFGADPSGPGVLLVHAVTGDGSAWHRTISASALADAGTGTFFGGALPMLYNGSTYDRARGDTTNGLDVDVTRLPLVSSSTDVSLASSASTAQLLASNTARRGLMLTNTDANDAYIYYGTTATLAKFSAKIPAGAYWEMPTPVYTGRIDAIWAADGSGSLIGSEL